jgi:ribosomal protein S27AE
MTVTIQIKSCPRCLGDMMLEEYLGEREFVCLQCGYRLAPATVPGKKAA